MEMIGNLVNMVENADKKLHTEARYVNMVDRKSASCGMTMAILSLLVATVVIAVQLTD